MASNSVSINPDIIKRTKGSLGALITKPALTDKLLSKPPFRFLHDILTEVLRNTGFLHGLFTEEEMNSENVKDKDRKVLFLQKVIDVLMFATGQKLKVKPSRIVAGTEAEKTNEMLQLVAYCVQKKIDSSEAVRKVLNGEKPFSGQDKTEDKAKQPEGKEREPKVPEDSELAPVSSRVKLPEKEGDRGRGADAERKRRGERARRERRDPSEEERGKKGDSSEEKIKKREVSEERLKRGTSRDGRRPPAPEQPAQRDQSPPHPERPAQFDVPESSPPNPRQRPASAKRSRRHEPDPPTDKPLPDPGTLPPNNSHISMGEGDPTRPVNPPAAAAPDAGSSSDNEQEMEAPTMMSRPPIRPSTARRAPPKRKDNSQEGIDRILSGKKDGPKVYLDSEQDLDDTEEQFIVQESVDTLALAGGGGEGEDEESQQGALTKKLFETKKHLEGDLVQEGEQGFVNDAQRHKQKEVAQKEIGQMQQAIQSICQNVSPLSKIIDFIHEDLESMHNELDKWQKETSKHSAALLKEEAAIEEELQPDKEQLDELETQISEVEEDIRTSRYNYYQNEERIKKLIEGISFASQQ